MCFVAFPRYSRLPSSPSSFAASFSCSSFVPSSSCQSSLLHPVTRSFFILSLVPSSSCHSSLLHPVTGPFFSMSLTISSSCRSHLPRLATRASLLMSRASFPSLSPSSRPLSFRNCAFLVFVPRTFFVSPLVPSSPYRSCLPNHLADSFEQRPQLQSCERARAA
jgi:hypothetical protein